MLLYFRPFMIAVPAFLRKALPLLAFACFPACLHAQDTTYTREPAAEIDPSKPSNLYSSVEVSGEWQQSEGSIHTWGTRISGSYAPSERHLLQVELPFVYHTGSGKMGIGDLRGRYFGLVKKDDTKVVSALGGSLDVFFPTGNRAYGLGSGSWIIAPGIIAGITLSPKVLVYPIVSFVHITKPHLDGAKASNGGSIEVLSVFDLGANAWLQFTPKFSINDFENKQNTNINFRLNLGKMVKEDLSLAAEAFWEAKSKFGPQHGFQLSIGKYFL